MIIPDWLARRAATAPAAPALIAGGRAYSFAALDAMAWAAAERLRTAGVAPGDRVALLAHNSPAFVAVAHAMPRCGATLVPLNTRLSPAELAWQLADVGARLLLADAANLALARAASADLPDLPLVALAGLGDKGTRGQGDKGTRGRVNQGMHRRRRFRVSRLSPSFVSVAIQPPPPSPAVGADSFFEPNHRLPHHVAVRPPSPARGRGGQGVRAKSVLQPPPPPIDLAAPHTIIYTSGTTGRPKGALLTYGNHWWSATASALNLGLRADDRWLAVLPLFHVGGLSILMRGAIYGIPVVLHERFDPAAVNAAIDAERVTIISVVAIMLQRLLEERGERPYPAHLRCVLLGGGPAPRPLLAACAARGVPVVQTYGMTETASQAVTLAPADALRKLGSAGHPLLPLELRVDAAPGAVGEILLRGPMVTPGYYGRPEATAAAIRDGWLHTGDLGYQDPEGYLYVVDRRGDLIIAGGENIYPAEVEAALLAHPAVAEAGVVGMPDPAWGQVPVAFVVLRTRSTGALHAPAPPAPGLASVPPAPPHGTGALHAPPLPTSEILIAFCRARLAGYKVPRRITIVDELPRTAAGKLRRNLLRERGG